MIQRLYDARKQPLVTWEARENRILLSEPPKIDEDAAISSPGRLLALDLGARRVGLATCDELRLSTRALAAIERRSWKDLLSQVKAQIETLSAAGLVIGLPLNIDGSEGPAAHEARAIAEKFRRSLNLPVHLQDERLTTAEAKARLRGRPVADLERQVDSEAAAIILQDFISRK
jgi:putative Holliday junction resolvase